MDGFLWERGDPLGGDAEEPRKVEGEVAQPPTNQQPDQIDKETQLFIQFQSSVQVSQPDL